MYKLNIIAKKKELRKKYRKVRKEVSEDFAIRAASLIAEAFIENIIISENKIVAGYIPRDDEINVIPLMQKLQSLGHKIVVPIVDRNSDCLLFQEWKVANQIENYVIPNVVITPLIAFDQNQNRLGFGGGWYDRTIEKLRPLGCKFIGVAYDLQFCKQLPIEDHDQALDNIVTVYDKR